MHSKIWSRLNLRKRLFLPSDNSKALSKTQKDPFYQNRVHFKLHEHPSKYLVLNKVIFPLWSMFFTSKYIALTRITHYFRNGIIMESPRSRNWRWIEPNPRFVLSIKYNSTVKHAGITLITCIILSHCTFFTLDTFPTLVLPLINSTK